MEDIEFANIEIRKSGDVYSPDFNDIYFSPAGGYMESLHVFLEPNKIPLRFLEKDETSVFEAGFGTGLNFLLTLKLFFQFAPRDSKLLFTSVERYPIKPGDLEKIHKYFIHLTYESTIFLNQYKKTRLNPGLNKFLFNKRVELNLIIDDLENTDKYDQNINYDAWYLDGFNPSENPEMWTDHFFRLMWKQSNKGASFSTFSAAGFIKRGLEEKGFMVKRIKGFNRKRNMITGVKP